MVQNLLRSIFGGGTSAKRVAQIRIPRHSTGFGQFAQAALRPEGRRVLDLGPTSPSNIMYLTGRGHKAYNEDLLAAAHDPAILTPTKNEKGEVTKTIDVGLFLQDSLVYPLGMFDAVLLWDVCDYLPEALVKPVVEKIHQVTKEKGMLLGFFHLKTAGPEAPYYRYHICDQETLELQEGASLRLQRVFANRHIEKLFNEFSSIKFFLGKDNIREVLIVR